MTCARPSPDAARPRLLIKSCGSARRGPAIRVHTVGSTRPRAYRLIMFAANGTRTELNLLLRPYFSCLQSSLLHSQLQRLQWPAYEHAVYLLLDSCIDLEQHRVARTSRASSEVCVVGLCYRQISRQAKRTSFNIHGDNVTENGRRIR